MKKLFLSVALLIIIAAAFWAGRKTATCTLDAGHINEIHFVDPKYIRMGEPTFQSFMANIMQDSLRKIKPPFTIQKINLLIDEIGRKTRLNNYIKLIKADSSDYKILVSNNDMYLRSGYLLITKDSCFYMKPLKIINDLPLR